MDGLRITSTIARRFAIVVLLGATFVFSAWLTVYALFHSGQVGVPNVVGMTREEAERTIEGAGLAFKPRRIHFDGKAPSGAVTGQDPPAGLPVKSGFEVKVDISKGPNPAGTPEEEPEPPGPTNPVERPKDDAAKKKKKADNANANTNATTNANTNAKKPDAGTAKPTATNTAKPADTAKPKPEAVKPETEKKPKPPVPRPPPTR